MGIILNNGIEFVLPGIFKAYRSDWAEEFLKNGTIYFTNLSLFKQDEDVNRGDPLEGTSVTIRQGVRCTGRYSNPIFVFCTTMETDRDTILNIWSDRNTVLQITDPLLFISRTKDAAIKKKNEIISMHVGPVTYDKDVGSHSEYHWAEGIFQKNIHHNGQKEFRIAFTGDIRIKSEEHIILNLGDCSDIARIM